jgi:hypothetical protein
VCVEGRGDGGAVSAGLFARPSAPRRPRRAVLPCALANTPHRACPSAPPLPGNQAVQMVAAGLRAIYLSGWQVRGP